MNILAHGHYSAAVHDAVPSLKELVKATTGDSVRRVGRFIQLALIGAARCLQDHNIHQDAAIYLTSGRGDLEVTLEVLEQMIEHGLPPKPLSFINTVSNSACFYLAKHCELHGRSQCVTRRYAPLESALQLAMLDISAGEIGMALVGSVDICTMPLQDHRQRLGVDADTPIGEGSHWFLLGRTNIAGTALAQIDCVASFNHRSALSAWLRTQHYHHDNTVFAPGQHVDSETLLWLQTQLPDITLFRTNNTPWYDSHCGNTLGMFLQQQNGSRYLHIDHSPSGCFNVLQVSR